MTEAMLLLSLLTSSWAGNAVCLEGFPSIREEFERRSLVFIAEVVSERAEPEIDNWYDGTTYTLRVREVLKGSTQPTLEVFSENSSGRFPMDVGRVYLLFVYHQGGRTAVDNCGNSGLLSESRETLAEVLRVRGGTPRREEPDTLQVYTEEFIKENGGTLPKRRWCPVSQYPRRLQQRRTEGRVLISFVIDEHGDVQEHTLEVLEMTHAGFVQPTMNMLVKCTFDPGRLHGAAVRVRVDMPVIYTLESRFWRPRSDRHTFGVRLNPPTE